MKFNQQRLILTPKIPSSLGAVPLRHDVVKLVDPNPEFDLQDIRLELEEIEARHASKYGSPSPARSRDAGTSALAPARRFGGNVLEVANFGRGGFRMQLSDSDLSSDEDGNDDDDIIQENAVTPVLSGTMLRSPIERQNGSESGRIDFNWELSGRVVSPLLPKTDEAETALREVDHEDLLEVKEEIKQTQVRFEEKFSQEQRRATERFLQLERDEAAKRERARRIDKQDHRMIAEARDIHLSALQRDHEQRTQVEERAIRKEVEAEEARKREIDRQREQQRRAREEAEAVATRKAEAERQKAAEDAAKRKAKAAAIQRAALQEAERQEKVKEEAQQATKVPANEESSKTVASAPKPRMSEEAARQEDARLRKLKELQHSYKETLANPALKKELKDYERQIIKHLQQVSATQEQVRKKSSDLIQMFQSPNGPPIQYLIVTLGAKLLSQCESQVQKLPSFAFALAQVVVNVASQIPFVVDGVLAQLHQACIFTVPKYYVFSKNTFVSDEAYYKVLGYREEDGKMESTDEYVLRMNAYVTFYAALTQTEVVGGTNPHGLGEGWLWCSRLLNKIPANRITASALEAFLKTAGFRLYQAYPKPFMKVMQVVVSEFLVSLKSTSDTDATAVVYRLETYLHTRQFQASPEGRNMPRRDVSSQMRA